MNDRAEARQKPQGRHSESQQSLAGQAVHSGGSASFNSTITSGRAAATADGGAGQALLAPYYPERAALR